MLNIYYSICHRVSMDLLRIVVMVVAVVVTTSLSSAIPQSDEHKNRVIDHVSIHEYLPSTVIQPTYIYYSVFTNGAHAINVYLVSFSSISDLESDHHHHHHHH